MEWVVGIIVVLSVIWLWRVVVGGAKGRLIRGAALEIGTGEARSFSIKVVGVTRKNNDGRSRQDVIRDCSVGDEMLLIPEPDNPVDPHAIAVYTHGGDQLGYLDARLAGEVSRLVARGGGAEASIADIVGGTADAPTVGVVLHMTKTEPG